MCDSSNIQYESICSSVLWSRHWSQLFVQRKGRRLNIYPPQILVPLKIYERCIKWFDSIWFKVTSLFGWISFIWDFDGYYSELLINKNIHAKALCLLTWSFLEENCIHVKSRLKECEQSEQFNFVSHIPRKVFQTLFK